MGFLEAAAVSALALGLAELGDKTQLAVLALAARHRSTAVFAGVMAAFALVDGAAILFGEALTAYVSEDTLRFVSGGLFIFVGLYMYFSKADIENGEDAFVARRSIGFFPSAMHSFMLVAALEMGDKTQLGAALLATRYDSSGVFAGAMAGLGAFTLAAIYAGKVIARRIPAETVRSIAAALFIVIGATTLLL